MNVKNIRALIQEILKEEIGRNYRTPNPLHAMYDEEDVSGVSVNISVHPSMKAWVVIVDGDDKKTMTFKSEEEAKRYADSVRFNSKRNLQSKENFPSNFRDIENIK